MNGPPPTLDEWNPEDGPPPTDEELAEAASLAAHLAGNPGNSPAPSLLGDALAVRATAHKPPADAVAASVRAALDAAVSAAQQRRRTRSLRLVAVAAALVFGVSALPVSRALRARAGTPALELAAPESPVFTTALGEHAGSAPSALLSRARTRDLRERLLDGALAGASR